MKLIDIKIPSFSSIDWKSPITIISVISVFGWILRVVYPDIIIYGGIYAYPVAFHWLILEFLLYSFLHGSFLHIVSNVLFFLTIGRIIEKLHGKKWVLYLWLWTTIFVGIFLYNFSANPTIGGSGFAMALLVVFAYDLYTHKQNDYKGAVILIVINLLVGLTAGISFIGHFSGALAGAIFIWWKKRKTLHVNTTRPHIR